MSDPDGSMIAARYRVAGPAAEVLEVENDVPRPQPGAGEVRVRLRVAAVNHSDWKLRLLSAPDSAQTPGQDGAGVIDAVGEGVASERIGERVWVWFAAAQGRVHGTAAQWTVLPSRQAVQLPEDVGFDHGAQLGIPALTAWLTLGDQRALRARTVLIAGGAGAVGNAAISLARAAGAHVVTTVRDRGKAHLAADAGAHLILDPKDPDAAKAIHRLAPSGVDRIVELALGANLALDLDVLSRGGTLVVYASDIVQDLPVRELMFADATLSFKLIYNAAPEDLSAAVEGVRAALGQGTLRELPATRFPLDAVAVAHDAVQEGLTGRVLLDLPS